MKAKILIMDDEAEVIESLKYNLEEAGFDVETARDAADGLSKARTLSPDLILLDANFPETNGSEICSLLRATAATSTIPIILLTGSTPEIDRLVASKLRVDDWVAKSFSPRELLLHVTTQILAVKEALFSRVMERAMA